MELKKLHIFRVVLFLIFITFFGIFKSQSKSDFYISDEQGNQNPVIDCGYLFANGNCLNLTAHYPQYKLTDSYSVSSKTYSPYSVTGKTVIKDNLDDVFTNTIDLPFKFCFYGASYDKIIIGSNGMISFDINQANLANAPNFTNSLPSNNLPVNSIFGALQDIYFSTSDDSEISYAVIGAAPFRKFVVDFYKGNVSGCDTQTSTSQIVLSEGSNTIEIYVQNKDIPCDLSKFKNALIGISDVTGTQGMAAPGRNTGIWTAQNEGWIFSPAGNNLVPEFKWYDSLGNLIGTSKDQQVCPQKDETYKVDITYTVCGGTPVTYTSDINVKFATDYPTTLSYTKNICNVTDQITLADYKQFLTTNNISNFNFVFKDAATGQIVNENTAFTISANRKFLVTIINKNTPACNRVTNLDFKFLSEKILTNTLYVCDSFGKNYELRKFNEKLVGNGYRGTVGYFISQNDAKNNINEIKTDDLTDGKQYYVRLSNQGCVNVLGPVTIKFDKSPVVILPINITLNMCDINANGIEKFDWYKYLMGKITTETGVTIRVFYTYNEAFDALPSNIGLDSVREGKYKLYARVEFTGGCFSIAEINMDVVFEEIILQPKSTYICFDGTQDITVNLDDYTKDMLIDPLDGSVKAPIYFESYQDALDYDPTNPAIPIKTIPNPQNYQITDNGDYVVKTIYARYEKAIDCFSIAPISFYLIHLTSKIDNFNICDFGNDDNETIQLNQYSGQVVNPSANVLYFETEPKAIANDSGTNITTISTNGNKSVTVYVRANIDKCVTVFPITFNLVKTPSPQTDVIIDIKSICDNNADGIENINIKTYESKININNENVVLSYYANYDPVTKTFSGLYPDLTPILTPIPISNGTMVYAKVKFNDSDCYSVSKISFNVSFNPPIYLNKDAKLELCNQNLKFGEIFNLSDATPKIFDQSVNAVQFSDLDISYYDTEANANAGTATGKISSSYPTSKANVTVYARFQSKTYGCYSVAPINLLTYFPVKAKNSVIEICDNNLDGYYDVNLMDYKDQMVQTPSPNNNYTFYLNQADIDVPGKEIKNPENFILNPYVSKIWVKVVNIKDCGNIAEINFVNGNKISLVKKQFSINLCDTDNDDKEKTNLSQFENTIVTAYTYEYYEYLQDINDNNIGNKIPDPVNYLFEKAKNISTFYVKVSQAGNCPELFTIDVTLNKTPIINIEDYYYYCKNNLAGLDIKPNFTGLDVVYYKWELPDGSFVEGTNQDYLTGVKTIGTYKLTLTNSLQCTYTETFKVINIDTPEIINLTGQNNYYVVTANGISGRKIVYSMDLVNWQDGNTFYNLKEGDYTFYVKYADSDCYGDMRRGRIFTVINTITPNDDGVNDLWKLTGLDVFPNNSTLQIYDKYGAMVYTQSSNTEFAWNGKINGRNLPTDSYWYVITAADGRIYKGWILLKNRN